MTTPAALVAATRQNCPQSHHRAGTKPPRLFLKRLNAIAGATAIVSARVWRRRGRRADRGSSTRPTR